jgi:hypothetical protein
MTAKVVRSSNRGSKPGERRGGRQKGVPNKVTGALKDMILGALNEAGGMDYLVEQADANPTAFLTLVGKVLPLQVSGPGPDGEIIHEVRRTIVRPPA